MRDNKLPVYGTCRSYCGSMLIWIWIRIRNVDEQNSDKATLQKIGTRVVDPFASFVTRYRSCIKEIVPVMNIFLSFIIIINSYGTVLSVDALTVFLQFFIA